MNLFENLQKIQENENTINSNNVYKILKSHNIDKYASDFRYHKDFDTISFTINIGKNHVNTYPVGDYTIFEEDGIVHVNFWDFNNKLAPDEYDYTLEEFDEKMIELYRYCSRFYG